MRTDRISRHACAPGKLIPIRTARAANLLLLLLLTLPAKAVAQDYLYTTNAGTITITGYTGFGGAIIIPSTINDLPVTRIGDWAFYSNNSLTSVTIPHSVTNIGRGAFSGWSSLSAITVDAFNAFYSSADGILFNKNQRTLIQCPASKAGNYTVPNSVTTIGPWAFAYCIWLTSVTIPSSVTIIERDVFSQCIRLTGIYFGGNAPSVGPFVFDNSPFSSHATAYYLPGTAGWGSTFGGYVQHTLWQIVGEIPTAHWMLPNPRILNIGSSPGVQTNQFGFIISWATNASVAVEACTDLITPNWLPLQTNTLVAGTSYFSDPEWTNYPTRLYRLRWP